MSSVELNILFPSSGKNLGYEIFKERKGEEEFKRKMDEADAVGRKGN